MSEHDEETESGTPYWAYSDDEDLADVRGDLASPTWDGPATAPDGFGLDDDAEAEAVLREWWAETLAGKPPSRETVQNLLKRPKLTWTGCRGAADFASALSAWDLLGEASLRALQVAHDRDFQHAPSLGQAARQVLVAKCAEATSTGLAAALTDGHSRLRDVVDAARRSGRTALAEAVDGEVQLASKMLLLLISPDDASALAGLAGGLRRVGRPDLAEETATRGIDLHPDNPAPWVARAAARADLRNHMGALADLDRDLLHDDIPAAVTKIRILRDIGRLEEALALALSAAQAEPSERSITMLRVLAEQVGDDNARTVAEYLFQQIAGSPDRPASRLLGLLAADQLDRQGDHKHALLLAEVVAAEGPPWRRADDLLARLRRSPA